MKYHEDFVILKTDSSAFPPFVLMIINIWNSSYAALQGVVRQCMWCFQIFFLIQIELRNLVQRLAAYGHGSSFPCI